MFRGSSDEEDLEALLLEMAFTLKVELGMHIHLEDIDESDCESMFR